MTTPELQSILKEITKLQKQIKESEKSADKNWDAIRTFVLNERVKVENQLSRLEKISSDWSNVNN